MEADTECLSWRLLGHLEMMVNFSTLGFGLGILGGMEEVPCDWSVGFWVRKDGER